jgi:hypothetical protein
MGSRRFVSQVGVVMAVHGAFATLSALARRREGTLGKLRLNPIAEALQAKADDAGAGGGIPTRGVGTTVRNPPGLPAPVSAETYAW